ncbi:MAG: DUF3226 domain-containing protein [Pseudomonadota bacterium]
MLPSLFVRNFRTFRDLPAPRCFRDVHEPKAVLHTWLAWQEEPGTPMGLALTRRYLDPCHPRAVAFAAWLRRLFGAE